MIPPEPTPERRALEASLLEAKKTLSKCTLDSAWTLTIPAVVISVPLSIRLKTYTPLVFAAVSASGLDYYLGLKKCQDCADNVNKLKRRIAEIDRDLMAG